MILISFYYANSVNYVIDTICKKQKQEAITKFIEVIKQYNNESFEKSCEILLNIALSHVNQCHFDVALDIIDKWLEKYNNASKIFVYKLKECEL